MLTSKRFCKKACVIFLILLSLVSITNLSILIDREKIIITTGTTNNDENTNSKVHSAGSNDHVDDMNKQTEQHIDGSEKQNDNTNGNKRESEHSISHDGRENGKQSDDNAVDSNADEEEDKEHDNYGNEKQSRNDNDKTKKRSDDNADDSNDNDDDKGDKDSENDGNENGKQSDVNAVDRNADEDENKEHDISGNKKQSTNEKKEKQSDDNVDDNNDNNDEEEDKENENYDNEKQSDDDHDDNNGPVDKNDIIKYHEWGPEGIDIEAIIAFFHNRLFEYLGYKAEHYLKSFPLAKGRDQFLRREAPFLAVIAAANNDTTPQIYVSPALVTRSKTSGERLFPAVLPMVEEALSVDLVQSHNRKKYPHLISALEDGSIPVIFQTGDWKWCANHTYDYTDLNGNKKTGSVPKMIWSNIGHCGYNFAIPDYNLVPLSKADKQDLEAKKKWYPSWEDKIPKAFWRGAYSNPGREEMVNRYQNHTNFDVANVPYGSREGNYVPQQDSMKYRAVLDIDGQAWTDRFQNLLCQTSVVIKIQLQYTSYFNIALTPGVHYLPASLENLTEVVEYAVSDDNAKEMKGIIANANQWCTDHVVYEELKNDFLSILNGYVEELYRANSNWTSMWNEHSLDFLTGETAFEATSGWMPPQWNAKVQYGLRYGKYDKVFAHHDLVVTRLPKEETAP